MVKNYIFLGPPGSGKGTMAKLLSSRKNIAHISTGDIFRKNIKNGTELGKKVKTILSSGEYVPDSITNEIVKEALTNKNVEKRGFILDGYPRTKNQAEFLIKNNFKIDKVIILKAKKDIIIKRILNRAKKENRDDDTKEIILNRINVYENETKILIDFYRKMGIVNEINADSGSIEEVYNNLEAVI